MTKQTRVAIVGGHTEPTVEWLDESCAATFVSHSVLVPDNKRMKL